MKPITAGGVGERPFEGARSQNIDNNPMQSSRRAAGIRQGNLTRRANQGHFSIIPKSCTRPSRPAIAGASVAIAAEKSSPTIEIAGITAASDRLRVAEPRALAARAA
ncbi:hypothetical protein V1277_001883 [Bradyrhizobium sp. AZCC 1588]|uniref:hypothetical protein n=1 Tax=unclassified Bradyrhizobium TaxID=2631580 RepID=UPI002FF2488C